MEEKWLVMQKKADFEAIGRAFGIHPVTARLIRNRDVEGEEAIRTYLYGTVRDFHDPHLLKDADLLTEVLAKKIRNQKKIRIIGDYDVDGVMSTYILYRGLKRCGAVADTVIPDRIRDGYGLNEHLIRAAHEDGINTMLTCDNGIAALPEIAEAKKLGMTVLVTDHHEIPYREENGERVYLRSEADAIVDPKQPDCAYPFSELCGAAVAYKIIQLLYEKFGLPEAETEEFLEYAAFATVGDVMELKGENRTLVREGLKRLRQTKSPGMRALIRESGLTPEQISAYHIGFVLGPCVNASGRLKTAKLALRLFLEEDDAAAEQTARELVELNEQRKEMTAEGEQLAREAVEAGNAGEKVLVVYLPKVHESLAGIIAGRIRERYHRPAFVLTRCEDGVKGSGRSTEEYSMFEELCRCRELFTKFGGHPMAAGISLPEENVDRFRRQINANCRLTEADFIPKIRIDIAMPAAYPNVALVREFEKLEPFGAGNPKPRFADKDLSVRRARIVGKNQNVLRLSLETKWHEPVSAVYFGDIAQFREYCAAKFGLAEVEAAFRGQENGIRLAVVYEPEIDCYQGTETVQLILRSYR